MNFLNLPQLLRKQAEETPNSIAIVDGDTSITYKELNILTDSLAGYLQQQGVSFNKLTGIFMEKSAEYIIACFAALKAGGAYMPLDLAYPDAILSKIVSQDKPIVIITKSFYSSRLEANTSTIILDIDTNTAWRNYVCNRDAVSLMSPDNLAMVIYTSGSTGEPKGVLLSHRAIIHSYYTHLYNISFYIAGDRSAFNAFFPLEMLKPFFRGAACHIIPNEVAYDPKLLLDFIATYQITETVLTPSFLQLLINRVEPAVIQTLLSSLKVLWICGEVLTTELKNKILKIFPHNLCLFNWYGMSEFPSVSLYRLEESEDFISEFCPVGFPLEEVKVCLLDENQKAVSPGFPGELYVSGSCLASGYLNRPELIAERFVVFKKNKFYKTGDIATILPNGMLEIRGRCDSTVKIRGYSINLKAIENALQKTGLVKFCLVITVGKEGENKQIIAYILKQENLDFKIDPSNGNCVEIQEKIKSYLPKYMIPSKYIELAEIPLNSNGKVDQKALPLPIPNYEYDLSNIQAKETVSPEDKEAILKKLLERVLFSGRGQIEKDANFFDFGLNSLLSVELAALIGKMFQIELSVRDIYDYPTINKLLEYFNKGEKNFSTVILMRKDSHLDSGITPITRTKPLSIRDAKSILVTGATGFLGAFLLDELLRLTNDDVKLYCLVRTQSGIEDVGKQKIINNLKRYYLWNQEIEKRIIPIVGDLSQEYLGLSIERFEEYTETIDYIFHCAAPVNFLYSYDILRAPIVNGTREIIRLASTYVTKPLQYISTVGIFPFKSHQELFLENNEIDSFANKLTGGYARAKWVAEKLVWEAIARGLPACIYRPGYIGHHSITGMYNFSDFQFLVIDACKKIQCAPETSQVFFEMIPVNFLVKSIAEFANNDCNYFKVYNVTQRQPIPARFVFDLLKEQNYISKYVSVEEWKAKLIAKADKDGDTILNIIAQSFEENMGLYPRGESVYDCSLFEKALSNHKIQPPVIDTDYIKKAMFLNEGINC